MSGPPRQGYWARVWRDLRANRRASVGLGIVFVLALIGLLADLIANDKPYYLELDGERYFPVVIDYAVGVGAMRWPEPLLNADFQVLAGRADASFWPPIPYSAAGVDITDDIFEPPSAAH